jgi:multidrug transporter EmrE-like cation transporter
MTAKSLLLIFTSISLAVTGQLLLKSGMTKVGPIAGAEIRNGFGTVMAVLTNGQVIAGLSFYLVSAAVWLVVLSRVPLGIAYPLVGFSYVIVMLASRTLLNEPPISAARWLGAILISLGVILISRS